MTGIAGMAGQDDEHYVEEDWGYEYYAKGSYVRLDQPGDYLIGMLFDGLDVGIAAYIKIVPDETQKLTVRPTPQKIYVDGKLTEFDAYNINGNNYFKLRDLAKAVSGTSKQFDVAWDGDYLRITLFPGKAYTEAGGELVPGDGKAREAVVSSAMVFMDGGKKELDVKAYNIGGNNYYKLRDIAKALNIGVTWDPETKSIRINTDEDYADE